MTRPLTAAYAILAPSGHPVARVTATSLSGAYARAAVRPGYFVRPVDPWGEGPVRDAAWRCARCRRLRPRGDELAHIRCSPTVRGVGLR